MREGSGDGDKLITMGAGVATTRVMKETALLLCKKKS